MSHRSKKSIKEAWQKQSQELKKIEDLDKLFDELDIDKSETIQLIEIKKKLFDMEAGEGIIEDLKGANIINDDGEIQYEESIQALTDVNICLNDQNMKKAFDDFKI